MILPRPAISRRPASVAGFTLIELLVVILIIAVLAAMIIPAIGTIQRKARQTTSVSNLHQWYLGYSASVTEHEGEMPLPGSAPFTFDNPEAWYNRMPKAMSQTQFVNFTVSDRPRYGQKSIWINPGVSQQEASAGGFIFNYGYNEQLQEVDDSDPAAPGKLRPMRTARLQSPHLTILMGEKADALPGLNFNSTRTYWSADSPNNDMKGLANFLFCDGHVDLVMRSDFQGSKANDRSYLDTQQTNVSWFAFGEHVSKD